MQRALVAPFLLAALALAACGGSGGGSSSAPSTPPSTAASAASAPSTGAEGSTAGGATPITAAEAAAAPDGSTVTVRASMVEDVRGVRLCDGLTRSLPPQCVGAGLTVAGLDPTTVEGAQEQGGVRWAMTVTVTGTMAGGALVVG